MTTLTIFEGPDGAGKTTAIGEIFNNPARDKIIIHHGTYPDLNTKELIDTYLTDMNYSGIPSRVNIVFDRCWVSELIYGMIYRKTSRLNVTHINELEKVALSLKAIIVLCLPPIETILKNYKINKRNEYVKDEDVLISIYNAYEAFYELHCTNLNMIKYDYTTMTLADIRYCLSRKI